MVAALLLVKRAPGLAAAGAAPAAPRARPHAKEAAAKAETDNALARRQEIGRLEERLVAARGALDTRAAELDTRASS